MPRFSENLQQLQELEDRYRRDLEAYEREVTAYRTLLEHNSSDPALPDLYKRVEEKNRSVQQTYTELEALRRSLGGDSKSSSLA